MKTLAFGLVLTGLLLCNISSSAQVDAIKKASSNHASSRGSVSSRSGRNSDRGYSSGIFVDLFFGSLVQWQEVKLRKKEINPTVISFDVMLQGAIQPSSYYILHPRIRGNWGLFSTDFRFNYLIEEEFKGVKHIRTNEWQILQMNVITTRHVIARIGGGILNESFSGGKTFGEGTLGLHLQTTNQQLGGMIEYRWSEPRTEWNAQAQFRIFQTGSLNGYVTAGLVHQQYYNTINVWGMQGGFMLRIF